MLKMIMIIIRLDVIKHKQAAAPSQQGQNQANTQGQPAAAEGVRRGGLLRTAVNTSTGDSVVQGGAS